jgi:hypothetical protein
LAGSLLLVVAAAQALVVLQVLAHLVVAILAIQHHCRLVVSLVKAMLAVDLHLIRVLAVAGIAPLVQLVQA